MKERESSIAIEIRNREIFRRLALVYERAGIDSGEKKKFDEPDTKLKKGGEKN